MDLTLRDLQAAVTGNIAAFRASVDYEPAGGPGTPIFPATYEGGKCAEEKRWIDGAEVNCVLIDSVQSQANRMEETLRDAWERRQLSLPVVSVDFNDPTLLKRFKVTSLDAPHRIADALLRDSLADATPFRKSSVGKILDSVDVRNAAPLFERCPTALVFGLWDSTGPRGGLGAKFQRAIVSEIVGLHAVRGKKTSSRIDPAQIMLNAGPLFRTADGSWTLDEAAALRDKKGPVKLGKDGKPSEANHGNIPPQISDGGFTVSKARQTTVVSLAALRRLRFPLNGASTSETDVDKAARTALAALALCAASLAQANGTDLRSRCQLHPLTPASWEILDVPPAPTKTFTLPADAAVALFNNAVDAARKAGLPWADQELVLTPSANLLALLLKSQQLAATSTDVVGA